MNIQERYEEVKIFNKIAGNLDNVTVDSLEAQMKVVVEEVKELQDAFDSQNATELLDGACDAFVTLSGLMQQMEIAGFKVDEALKRVNDNNLSKYPAKMSHAEAAEYWDKGWTTSKNYEYDCYVIKDANMKIRKPVGFKSVNIADLALDLFSEKMTWEEALAKIINTDKYIVKDSLSQKVQYQIIDGQVHWTHFGSAGGKMSDREIEEMRADKNANWTIKNSPYGAAA